MLRLHFSETGTIDPIGNADYSGRIDRNHPHFLFYFFAYGNDYVNPANEKEGQRTVPRSEETCNMTSRCYFHNTFFA
ncbi:hypothetical protein DPPLL_35030 [Desulfofustis limnaeus]|uniref:Uncharacterized protein n=1 Tax=Desulfofustis limnaeus TaxID=2740163 RepID=A0ABM7WDU9_9BACT|nr:hypothetical protein DPPLL_35030 [Desulfofustis limnaeus]